MTLKTAMDNLTDILQRDGIPYEFHKGKLTVMNFQEKVECVDNGLQSLRIKLYRIKDGGTWDSYRVVNGNVRKAVTIIGSMWKRGIEHAWTDEV